MKKYNYRLCYESVNGVSFVDIEALRNKNQSLNDALEGVDSFDIKAIATLTSHFKDLEGLLNFLRKNKVIDENATNLFVTVDEKNKKSGKIEYKRLKNSEVILFKDSLEFLSIKGIYNYVLKNKKNGYMMKQILSDLYLKQKEVFNKLEQKQSYNNNTYEVLKQNSNLDKNNLKAIEQLIKSTQNSIHSFNKVLNLYSVLIGTVCDIEKFGYDTMSNSAKLEYENRLRELMFVEFFDYIYNRSTYSFERKVGNKFYFRKIYDFAVYMKVNKDRIENKNFVLGGEHKLSGDEEFITGDDYKRLRKRP